MFVITDIRRQIKKVTTAAAMTIVVVGTSLGASLPAAAISIGGPSDCDSNAIIRCGAHSTSELMSAYRSSSYVQSVYHSFGITSGDMANLSSTNVVGKVTNRGNVYIEGQSTPVATDAITGGRENIPGSTKVTSGSATFYKRPPSVSFQQASLPAFVAMSNGRFQFAIIASCGNAVSATAVVKPKSAPAPTPAPTPPAPAPVAPAVQQSQSQSQTQSQSVVVQTPPAPAPAPAPTPAPAPAAQPAALPSTGANTASIASLVGLTIIAGYWAFRRYLLRHSSL